MHILIVDDNEENLYLLKILLEGNGHSIVESKDGKDALIKLMDDRFDLIISDILMPVMDGFSLCRKVKKTPALQHIPVIIYTATYTGPQDEKLALEIGADRFVIKPCEPVDFMRAVNEVMSFKIEHEDEIERDIPTEEDVLKLYNERLIRKLEQKMLQTEVEIQAKLEALEALRRSEALLNASQRISKIGGWEWDLATQEMFWTDETYRIHEIDKNSPSAEYNKMELSLDCYFEEDKPRVLAAFQQCSENGEPYNLEARLTTKTGRDLYIRTAGQALYENGKIIKVLGSIQDITEQKQAEIEQNNLKEQLLQSQKLDSIGQLASGVAHDFNNILTVILGYSDLILQLLKRNEPAENEVQEIINAGNRAFNLTRQLLTFSRKHAAKPEVLNLNTVISDLNKMLYRIIGEDINMTTNLAGDLWNIKADITQIEQVIVNLVVNAREAMPKGGKLLIETSNKIIDQSYEESHIEIKPCKYVMLVISDSGCGMDKETQNRIFEPFFTTKGETKGTGLGLSTVYGIVKQAEGFIWVYSEINKGTSFKILFPLTDDVPLSCEKCIDHSTLNGNGEYILVVEDDVFICNLLSKMLTKLGYKVKCFENAEKALLGINEKDSLPDLIITDIIMPGMNGKEFADLVQKMYPKMKLLFMSGYTESVISQYGIIDSDIPFLQKPFTQIDLAKQINLLLGK